MTVQKILLADDSVTIRKVVELTFADEGIEVVSVGDGDAAMERFHQIRPDLVMADVNMPGLSGYDICKLIKSDDSTRHIPVILLVGTFEQFDPGEASQLGANYYFTKPFNSIRELVEKVTTYLQFGASSESDKPETADIEDLYSESFQDTLEINPSNHIEVPLSPVLAESGTVDGPSDNVIKDQEAENTELSVRMPGDRNEKPEQVAFGVLGPLDTEVPQVVTQYSETSEISSGSKHEVENEFGDAGMDDAIIETSHPSTGTQTPEGRFAKDPFDRPVGHDDPISELVALSDSAESVTGRSDVLAIENEPVQFPAPTEQPFELETRPNADPSHDVRVADRHKDERSWLVISEANIAPELIESIVNRVLARMSDRAVRDAAQESVPLIAEKLIREALAEENK